MDRGHGDPRVVVQSLLQRCQCTTSAYDTQGLRRRCPDIDIVVVYRRKKKGEPFPVPDVGKYVYRKEPDFGVGVIYEQAEGRQRPSAEGPVHLHRRVPHVSIIAVSQGLFQIPQILPFRMADYVSYRLLSAPPVLLRQNFQELMRHVFHGALFPSYQGFHCPSAGPGNN